MSSKDLIPNAFWTALSNQNVAAFGQPQWSIVVNDAGIQCSLFFENPNATTSSVNSSSTEYCQAKLESQTSNSSRDAVSPIKPDVRNSNALPGAKRARVETSQDANKSDQSDADEEIDCTTEPSMINPVSAPPMVNLPLLQQFFVQQLQAQQQQQQQQQQQYQHQLAAQRAAYPKVEPSQQLAINSVGLGVGSGNGVDAGETPKPSDLSLIPAENRRRLTNLREEAAASRLSVTAFIRRGALLYFDSEELAVNRLHTLNQSKLHALELETKFFFGEVPQQLFRRTIAIQQSQIRSKRSSASLSHDRSTSRPSLVTGTQAPPPPSQMGPRSTLNPTLFSSLVTSQAQSIPTTTQPTPLIGNLASVTPQTTVTDVGASHYSIGAV